MTPRPIGEQVVVITGASSGIGRAAAQLFGQHGASVVLAARGEDALRAAADEVERAGGQTLIVPTDVADPAQVEALAQKAVEKFGRIDTWVNDAAVSEYALVTEQSPDEFERIMQVNYLGTVYGCKAAVPRLTQSGGGTIINIGSVLSERAIPLQVAYCASKHAVKGFTEGLRMELAHQNLPINVTLVLPTVINTPFYTNARNRMAVRPKPMPPAYPPAIVAETIVFAAQHPRRTLYAGGPAKALSVMELLAPGLTDKFMTAGGGMFKMQQSDQPEMHDRPENLYAPIPGPGKVGGDFDTVQKRGSFYTRHLEWYPNRKRALLGLAILGAALWRRRT